jgi:hypothetical protein
MYDVGDALLFTVSAWRECTWGQFRDAFDELHLRWLAAAGSGREQGSQVRIRAARTLENLGHMDLLFEGSEGTVAVGPPVLAQIPVPGLPRAVLCGSRAPESVDRLRDACRDNGEVWVLCERQVGRDPFAPARIELRGTSTDVLHDVAERLRVAHEPVAPAWSLLSASASLEAYRESLSWREDTDLNWRREDFDPGELRFGPVRQTGDLVLSRYIDPVRGTWRFWLWRGQERAEVDDPSWARFAVLSSAGQRALTYDAREGSLAVPASVPLPRLLARAMALTSGYAPSTINRPDGKFGSRRYQVFPGVAADTFDACARKTGQLLGSEEEAR